jgi:ABC-type polysaccharide/polyol phosphate export permease
LGSGADTGGNEADLPIPVVWGDRSLTLITWLTARQWPADHVLTCRNPGRMPAGLRQFAEYEPFTPVTQTVRGLLTGGPVGAHAITAIAWSAGIALASYLWAVRLYNRRRASEPN